MWSFIEGCIDFVSSLFVSKLNDSNSIRDDIVHKHMLNAAKKNHYPCNYFGCDITKQKIHLNFPEKKIRMHLKYDCPRNNTCSSSICTIGKRNAYNEIYKDYHIIE